MIDILLLGVIEGVTEFLPVSSTGHLLIAQQFVAQRSDAFNILIQIGPVFAALLIYRSHLWQMVTRFRDPAHRRALLQLTTSFVLTGVGGLALSKLGVELPEEVLPVAVATLVGAAVIFWAERQTRGRTLSPDPTWVMVFAVAFAQLLAAVFPGTSRSGACIMAALLCGVARPAAVEFSFLLGIPTLVAAGGLKTVEAVRAGQGAELIAPESLLAFAVATVTAFVVVKWLLRFIQSHTFVAFAWYRIALGLALLAAHYGGFFGD